VRRRRRLTASFRRNGELRFRFQMAKMLGMTVSELSQRMTALEMVYWRALALAEQDDATEAE
jgi:hypothetical protein